MRALVFALCLCLTPVLASAQPKLGAVRFENSGAPAAKEPFLRGLGWLHNFQYEDAAAAFREAQVVDPDFALAYWGEAMTHNHPVWMEQDAAKARSVLARLGPTPGARVAKAKTPREAAYLRAVEALYGEGDKEARDRAYAAAMAQLHRDYPTDVDAAAFHALALLGTAHNGRDTATYMRAAAILEEVFPANPQHPGVLHYLIHSYDDPAHAPLGLRAARLYDEVAQGSPHALHMTSHIFLALGMWDDVVASNLAATEAAATRAEAAGRPPMACGHGHEWLTYAYLQQGRLDLVDRQIAACRVSVDAELATAGQTVAEGVRSMVASYADMVARRAIETGEWRDPGLPLAADTFLRTRYVLAYGEALANPNDAARAQALAAEMAAILPQLHAARGDFANEAVGRELARYEATMQAQVEALANPDAEEGLAALRLAAEAESDDGVEFGPPQVYKPTQELIADRLLALGRPDEAAAAYRAALQRAPGRALSLAGLKAAGG